MQLRHILRPVVAQLRPSVGTGLTFVRTATKRAAGSKTSMKDSAGRALGAKTGDGELVKLGQIVYRQRGTKIYPGENMGIGRDHTLFALEPGYVRFYYDPFHPRRKLVGVALAKHERLPTPHFAPRRRRFGLDPIEDAEKAERELSAMKRKAYLAKESLEHDLEDRLKRRQRRQTKLANTLQKLVNFDNEEDLKAVAERFFNVEGLMQGGRDETQARKLADQKIEQEAKVAQEFRNDPAPMEKLPHYTKLFQTVDAKVMMSSDITLIPRLSKEEGKQMAKETMDEATEMVRDESKSSKYRKRKLTKILVKPCFSQKERNKLYRRYLGMLSQPSIDMPLDKMQALADEGKGKIVKKWNYEKRRVDRLFLPRS